MMGHGFRGVDAGHALGMSITQFVWGNAVSSLDPEAADPHSLKVGDPHASASRQVFQGLKNKYAKAQP